MRAALAMVLVLGAACGAPSRGALVEPGVGVADFDARANGTDRVHVRVLFPAQDDGSLLGGAHPAVVFVQGGAVKPERYEWQAVELVKRGYVVALPRFPLDLAFFATDFGQAARGVLVDGPEVLRGAVDASRISVAGHSLGGVVAVKLLLGGGFSSAVLEASFPDTADHAALAGLSLPTLSLAGSLDCSAKLENVRTGWDALPSPSSLLVLDGVTHYQFTDAQTEDDSRGCTPGVSIDVAHQRIAAALAAFLAGDALDAVPGSTLEVR